VVHRSAAKRRQKDLHVPKFDALGTLSTHRVTNDLAVPTKRQRRRKRIKKRRSGRCISPCGDFPRLDERK